MGIFPKPQKKFYYRHKILEYLYNKVKDEPLHRMDLKKSISTYEEISNHLGITTKQFREYHEGFHTFEKEHVQCWPFHQNGAKIGIQQAGIPAYLDEFWLREGERELNEKIYDKTKWMIPILALLLTVISLAYSTCIVAKTNNRIKVIEEELNKLKPKAYPSFQLPSTFPRR